jgi:hypothetical protein
MKKQKKGVAFVASTLPAKIIINQINNGLITKIYTSTEGLKKTYDIILSDNKEVEVESVNEINFIKRAMLLSEILKKEKSNKNFIYIYHECCWPWLDILIKFMKPDGYYMPQVKIDYMYRPSKSIYEFYKYTHFVRASCILISKIFFNYYYFRNDSGVGLMFLPVIKNYPKSIIVINESAIKPNKTDAIDQKRMLIIGGTDLADTTELIDIYKKIIDIAVPMGYEVWFKDHPNHLTSLNVNFENTKIIPSQIPLEIINLQFSVVVGTASAAMIGYGSSAVSICKLINSMSEEDAELRINYLLSHNPDARVIDHIDLIFS